MCSATERMDPRVELQPDQTLIVLGPLFAASLLEEDEEEKEVSNLPPLTYVELAEMLRSRSTSEDPTVMEWLENHLQDGGRTRRSSLLERLLELQREGALIAYSYVDETVSNAAQQTPVQPDQIQEWASGETKGILHLFGVSSTPASVQLTISQESATCLQKVLHERACVLLGFDSNQDSFQETFLQLCTESSASTPLLVTKESWSHASSSMPVLPLPVPDPLAAEVVCGCGDTTKSVGERACARV